MPGARAVLKKQITSTNGLRGNGADPADKSRSLDKRLTSIQERADRTEAECKALRRLIEQQREQLAAQKKQLELILSRADENDQQREDVYAALYALQSKISLIEEHSSTRGNGQTSQSKHNATSYRELVSRIREIVRASLPRDSTVLVAAKGDDDLLRLYGRKAWHFPQAQNGIYAGHHPGSSLAAIAHLEVLRSKGADHFLLPHTMFWWLDYYKQFRRYLETHYSLPVRQDDSCLIFALSKAGIARTPGWRSQFLDAIALCHNRSGERPSILDWNTGLDLAAAFPDVTIFSPVGTANRLPYMDESVDIVAVGPDSGAPSVEVKRIAKSAVMRFSPHENGFSHAPGLEIEWKQIVSTDTCKASIVIPSSGSLAETNTCLTAIRDTLPRNFGGELILVDTIATPTESDRLLRLARSDSRVKVLRSRKAKDFLTACNVGAKAATGDALIFVSVVVLPFGDWLSPLLALLLEKPEVGAVGGKLLDHDGTLVEAGGIMFSNGALDGFGHHDAQTDAPLYNFVREIDYCSLEFIATRRLAFDGLGGFDSEFTSLSYAAADYGLRLRREGHRFLYQPETAATYLKAGRGSDSTNLDDDAQRSSRNMLINRWAEILKQKPDCVNLSSSAAWHDFAGRL